MSFRGSKRVHIAPQGYETERIYKAAIEADADKVVLLVHDDQTDRGNECQDEVVEALEAENTEWAEESCNIFDISSTLHAIGEVVHDHPDDEIMVNISSGSKITAVAGVIACMATGAHPYYVKAEKYEGHTVASGVDEIIDVPAHPIGLPNEQFLEVMEWIRNEGDSDNNGVAKGDLVEYAYEAELPLLANYNRSAPRNRYDPVNKEIIEPLRNNGYLEETRIGQEKRLWLTEHGEEMLENFNFLLDRD